MENTSDTTHADQNQSDHLRPYAREILDKLPALERQVVSLRYGLNTGASLSREEIAQQLGITEDAVDHHEREGMSKMRSYVQTEGMSLRDRPVGQKTKQLIEEIVAAGDKNDEDESNV